MAKAKRSRKKSKKSPKRSSKRAVPKKLVRAVKKRELKKRPSKRVKARVLKRVLKKVTAKESRERDPSTRRSPKEVLASTRAERIANAASTIKSLLSTKPRLVPNPAYRPPIPLAELLVDRWMEDYLVTSGHPAAKSSLIRLFEYYKAS